MGNGDYVLPHSVSNHRRALRIAESSLDTELILSTRDDVSALDRGMKYTVQYIDYQGNETQCPLRTALYRSSTAHPTAPIAPDLPTTQSHASLPFLGEW